MYVSSFIIIDAKLFLKQLDLIFIGFFIVLQPLARMGASVTGIDAVDKNIKIAQVHAVMIVSWTKFQQCEILIMGILGSLASPSPLSPFYFSILYVSNNHFWRFIVACL